ncbi:transglutaminase-like domain-containing protein [Emcibacter sp. SYSU 3D8]|uniref:SirB1 family protein n=1 Tax=Emcibacter sp. SYSU 3D8 TaxID=3133969 RepID=UPI0031FF3A0A
MTESSDCETRLREIGAADGAQMPLAEAALLLASLDHPGREIGPYLRHLDELASGLTDRQVSCAADRGDALSTVIHIEHGYGGDRDSYDDMINANLMSVIDRRRGLPVALAILYIETARRAGWKAWGLDFPGHFVLRLDGEGDRVILDPFHAGVTVEPPALRQLLKTYVGPDAELEPKYYEPMSDRSILLRLLNNIRGRALQGGNQARGLQIMQRMLLIAPADARLWLESAAIQAKSGQLKGAREALETCLGLEPEAAIQRQAAKLMETLRRDLN